MSYRVFLATESLDALKPLLLRLNEMEGLTFVSFPEHQAWFESRGFSFDAPMTSSQLIQSLCDQHEQLAKTSEGWNELPMTIVIADVMADPRHQAELSALLSYCAHRQLPDVICVTHPSQYDLLAPDILSHPEHARALSWQLYQQLYPLNGLLPLASAWQPKDWIEQSSMAGLLWSTNPLWAKAIEWHKPSANAACQATITAEQQWQNVLKATELFVTLSQSERLGVAKVVVVQNGQLVNAVCHATSIDSALQGVLETNSAVLPGSTLILSHGVTPDKLAWLQEMAVTRVIAPTWSPESIERAASLGLWLSTFHVSRIQLGLLSLQPVSQRTVACVPTVWPEWPESQKAETANTRWLTKAVPHSVALGDAELGALLIQEMPSASAVLIHQQSVLAVSQAQPSLWQAVRQCLDWAVGEAVDATLVVKGAGLNNACFDDIIHARLGGVLVVGSVQALEHTLSKIDTASLPCWVGVFEPFGLRASTPLSV